MKKRSATFGLLLGAVTLLGAGCQEEAARSPKADAPASQGGAQVEVVNIAYSPDPLEISPGTEVTWTNLDEGVRHTVTSGVPGDNGVPGVSAGKPAKVDGLFDGDLAAAGESFSFTFDKAGTYAYFCGVHPSMTGKVVVN